MATFAKAQRIFEQGKLEESLALFHDGLQHRPNNAAAHLYAGLILVQQNRIGEAHTEFLRAIAIDSSLARAHIGLGVVLAQGGDLTGSTRELEEALKLEPENHEARYDLDLVKPAGRPEK